MKTIVIALLALCYGRGVYAQEVYISRNAMISFYSSAPIEDIAAKTDQAVSAINLRTGAVFFKVPIRSFQFERGLMQDHFNSDYLESDKYPYAEFKGKILDLPSLTEDSTYAVTVEGVLTIHGVSKPYRGPGTLEIKEGQLDAASSFKVRLADHHIKIPKLLTRNIAEVVDVKVHAAYLPQKETQSDLSAAGDQQGVMQKKQGPGVTGSR